MEEFLSHLQAKGFRDRTVGLIENGSWAPAAARLMRARLEEMKGAQSRKRGADGRADHGAVCEINI